MLLRSAGLAHGPRGATIELTPWTSSVRGSPSSPVSVSGARRVHAAARAITSRPQCFVGIVGAAVEPITCRPLRPFRQLNMGAFRFGPVAGSHVASDAILPGSIKSDDESGFLGRHQSSLLCRPTGTHRILRARDAGNEVTNVLSPDDEHSAVSFLL